MNNSHLPPGLSNRPGRPREVSRPALVSGLASGHRGRGLSTTAGVFVVLAVLVALAWTAPPRTRRRWTNRSGAGAVAVQPGGPLARPAEPSGSTTMIGGAGCERLTGHPEALPTKRSNTHDPQSPPCSVPGSAITPPPEGNSMTTNTNTATTAARERARCCPR